MTSMKNAQFLHPPLSPFSVCPNGSKLGKTTPSPGRRNLGYQPPPISTLISFGILAAYLLHLVGFPIT